MKELKKVQGMDRKTYLKYHIKVLEGKICEATNILSEKKREQMKLR